MGIRRRFTGEFKREAMKLATQPGAVTARIAEDLGLHANVSRKWVKQFADGKWKGRSGDPVKGEQQAELDRLRLACHRRRPTGLAESALEPERAV
jgi:transposase